MKLNHYIPFFIALISVFFTPKAGAAPGKDTIIYLTAENYESLEFDKMPWKFNAGDDSLWANRNYNDSAWPTTSIYIRTLNGANKIGFKGIGWFRIKLHADSSIADKPILLQFASSGAAEIYLDGVRIRKIGKIAKGDSSEYEQPFFPGVCVLKDTGVHVLAIRYENRYYAEMLRSWSGNNAGFALGFNDYEDYYFGRKEQMFFIALFLLISGGIFLALFLSHLVMYFFHKKYIANLIFSLFNLGLALLFIVGYLYRFAENAEVQKNLLPFFVLAPAVSFLILNLLVNKLFFWSKIRVGVSVLFLLATTVTTFVNFRISILIVLLYLTYTILEAAIMVIIAVRRKVPGARILSFGILSSALLFTFLVIGGLLDRLSFDGYTGVVFLAVSMLAIYSLPLSMSAYLAWSFAMVNKDLSVQLRKVGELSQKTLEQEQEKQRILESQKDDLENQVQARTSELVLQQEALVKEKKKSDDLLLNILPAEVAEELKETGTTQAQSFDHVSVLFTDFVNFTQVSERLNPQQLVQELHECFRAFDEIMERNSMEKIKTIGDAYLAVSGMPVASDRHAANAVQAGIEIVDFVNRRAQHTGMFQVRIGINSGPLVAGIVGVKKFAYDIWGDTVNTASRMESNSEAGRINISQSTYELVKDEFECTHRGKLAAKNKGDLDMYFIEKRKEHHGLERV